MSNFYQSPQRTLNNLKIQIWPHIFCTKHNVISEIHFDSLTSDINCTTHNRKKITFIPSSQQMTHLGEKVHVWSCLDCMWLLLCERCSELTMRFFPVWNYTETPWNITTMPRMVNSGCTCGTERRGLLLLTLCNPVISFSFTIKYMCNF